MFTKEKKRKRTHWEFRLKWSRQIRIRLANFASHPPFQQQQERNSPERERDFLHDYRREFRLDTPTSFSEPYHHWVLSQSKIGLQSPTMARRSVYRRQSRDDLAKTVRKHINGQAVQENDVIVAFLHRVRNPGVVRPRRDKNLPHSLPFP